MKKTIVSSVLVAALCLAFAQAGFPSGDTQSELSTIRHEIEALKQEVESLKQDVDNLKKTLPGRFQVAVFPSSLAGEGINYEDVVVSALKRTFENTGSFIPVYSTYPMEQRFGAKPLPTDIRQDQVWTRKSRWELFKPNVEEVAKAGKRLGVDVVLMVSVSIPGSENDQMSAYLIDVASEKLYEKTIDTRLKNILSGVLLIKGNELSTIIERVFWEYRMDKKM
ncbi:MAG: hypothetical protein HY788_12010 [Deltaproteobacteria bacterium]|nr:hypothetical protein [Deltaproteobacteria bacterium]